MTEQEKGRFNALGRAYDRKLGERNGEDRNTKAIRERLDTLGRAIRMGESSAAKWAVAKLRETLGDVDEQPFPWDSKSAQAGPHMEPIVLVRVLDSIMTPLNRMILQLQDHDLSGAAKTLVQMKADVARLKRMTSEPAATLRGEASGSRKLLLIPQGKLTKAGRPTPARFQGESVEVLRTPSERPILVEVKVEPMPFQAEPPDVHVHVNPTPIHIEAKPGEVTLVLPERKPRDIEFKTDANGKLTGATVKEAKYGKPT